MATFIQILQDTGHYHFLVKLYQILCLELNFSIWQLQLIQWTIKIEHLFLRRHVYCNTETTSWKSNLTTRRSQCTSTAWSASTTWRRRWLKPENFLPNISTMIGPARSQAAKGHFIMTSNLSAPIHLICIKKPFYDIDVLKSKNYCHANNLVFNAAECNNKAYIKVLVHCTYVRKIFP